MITLASIHSYPVKGCRGISRPAARLTASGIEHDREWMVVDPLGRAITQRDAPGLARVDAVVEDGVLRLSSDGAGELRVPLDASGTRGRVRVWNDDCGSIDQGDEAARWLGERLDREVRLVRFDPDVPRPSDPFAALCRPRTRKASTGIRR